MFIGGTGRSGTTILKRVLSLHSLVFACPQEARFLTDPNGLLDLMDDLTVNWSQFRADASVRNFLKLMRDCRTTSRWSQKVHDELANWDIQYQRYVGMNLGRYIGLQQYDEALEWFSSTLINERSDTVWTGHRKISEDDQFCEVPALDRDEMLARTREFLDRLIGTKCQAQGKTVWCEDTPDNITQAERLNELLPDAKFVHMVRDPRDVVVSYRSQPWGEGTINAIANRVLSVHRRWATVREELSSNDFMEVRLEDFVGNPKQTVKEICGFRGLEYEKTTELIQIKQETQRWKEELEDSETDRLNESLDCILSKYGYEVS